MLRLFVFALGALLTAVQVARAAGLSLIESATPEVGFAGAGRGARAQDAAVAFRNPAGMGHLDRSQFLGGFQPTWMRTELKPGSGTTTGGGGGGDAGGFIPALAAYYVHRFDEHWSAGLSLNSSFGSGLDYDDDWAGRYVSQKSELITAGLTPSVGYRVNRWLSLGAGFSAVYGKLENKVALRGVAGDPNDGQLKLEDTDWGFGGIVGVLIEPRQGTRFSVTYSCPVKIAFEDVASIEVEPGSNLEAFLNSFGLIGSKVDLEMTIPQMVVLSAYHELTDGLAVLASVDWEDQSEFGKTGATLGSDTAESFTLNRDFQDTWHASIGLQYRPAERWLITGGFAFDRSPVSKVDRTADLPVDHQWRYSAGLLYDLSRNVTLGVAYTYVDLGDAPIDQSDRLGGTFWGRLEGDYNTNEVHIWALTVSWKLGRAPRLGDRR